METVVPSFGGGILGDMTNIKPVMDANPKDKIAAALAKAQGCIEGATKDRVNPAFRSKYADLGAVWDACREHLSANGIAVTQPITHRDGAMYVVTRLTHASGQFMQDEGMPLLLGKQDMQGLGSAITYARRYGLMAMVGIAPEDDDGQEAVKNATAPKAAKTMPAEKKPDLVTRYKALNQALDLCKTAADLEKTWQMGNALLAELKQQDPTKYNALCDARDIVKRRFGDDPFTPKETA